VLQKLRKYRFHACRRQKCEASSNFGQPASRRMAYEPTQKGRYFDPDEGERENDDGWRKHRGVDGDGRSRRVPFANG